MYDYEIAPKLDRIIGKLYKKDRVLYEQIIDKIKEVVVCVDITHYKNLKYSMKEYKRVHVGHFVLIFKVENNLVKFEDFAHHDNIY